MEKKMVVPHLKSIKSSPLHCSHWKFGSGFYSPHGKIVLSFAPLVYNSLNDECPAVCNWSVWNRGEFGLFGSFPKGRCSSGHPFWFLGFSLGWRQICCLCSEKHQGKQIYRLFGRVTAVPPLLQGVCWISWRQKKEANWTSPNSLTSLLRSVNSHWEKDPGFVIASVEFLQVWSQSEQRCPAEKQLLLVCSLSDSPHPSRVPVHVSSVLRAVSDSLVQG